LVVGLHGVGLGPSAREYTDSEPASNSEAIRMRMTFFTSGSFLCDLHGGIVHAQEHVLCGCPSCHRNSETVTESTCLRPLRLVVAQPPLPFRRSASKWTGFRKP